MKDKILKKPNEIPVPNLVNYIKKGVVSFSELVTAGLNDENIESLRSALKQEEENLWQESVAANTYDSYNNYLGIYPDGEHAIQAREKINELDDEMWTIALNPISEENLISYKEKFPSGRHLTECLNLLDDLPWLKAKQTNTIEGYRSYQSMYPGRHDAEIAELINILNDDNDWNNACLTGTTLAYKIYLNQHPNGKHAIEANSRIQASAGHDAFLKALRNDPNAKSAKAIKKEVENNVASWDEIEEIFGEKKKDAIKNFTMPSELPTSTPPAKLQANTTEVYFWGTPSSGKTCALGAIISSASKQGILEKLSCPGKEYMDRLSNLFKKNGICTFPDSTQEDNIQEMILKLRDKKDKSHKITLIDLAGELFKSLYLKGINKLTNAEKKRTLEQAISYLKNKKNNKIHFFVVEYGGHDKEWSDIPGVTMADYLEQMITFLKDEKIFTTSTVGVYVLVTKSDKIDCDEDDRPLSAYEYVTQEMPAFWNTLLDTCKKSGVKDLKTISFSVGDVFAQNLCQFKGKDTQKVINKLLTKTRPESWWDWLKK